MRRFDLHTRLERADSPPSSFAARRDRRVRAVDRRLQEPTASPQAETRPNLSAVKFWEAGSSAAWNQTARGILAARGAGTPTTQSRIFTYRSIAQYNAIIAAEDAQNRGDRTSPAAAAAGASIVVLKSFFPLDGALLDTRLAAQRAATPWPGEQTKDFDDGEAIGRAVGALVLAYAATDRVNLTTPPPNPGGAGSWTGVNSLRGFYGARTFALTSGDQFRPGPPPCSARRNSTPHFRRSARSPMASRRRSWQSRSSGRLTVRRT